MERVRISEIENGRRATEEAEEVSVMAFAASKLRVLRLTRLKKLVVMRVKLKCKREMLTRPNPSR